MISLGSPFVSLLFLFGPHRLPDDLRNIQGRHAFFLLPILDSVRHHGKTEGTGHGHAIGPCRDRLIGSHVVDPLALVFLHPHPGTAGAATEGLGPVAIHFHQLHSGDSREYGPGGVIDAVVSTEETGIVVGKEPGNRSLQGYLAFGNQLGDDLRMMINLKAASEVWVIFLKGVIAVGTSGYNFLYAVAVHGFNIGLHHRLIEIFVAAPHGRIAAAAFFRSEDGEIDARLPQYPGQGHRYLLASLLEGTRTSHI